MLKFYPTNNNFTNRQQAPNHRPNNKVNQTNLLTKDRERNPLQVTQKPNFNSIFYILTKLQHISNFLPNGLNNLNFK